MDTPKVKQGGWIVIGSIDAVICNIYDQTASSLRVEIVYLNGNNVASNEDAIWKNDKWEFASSGVTAGYADKYPRLSAYVNQLRTGRHK